MMKNGLFTTMYSEKGSEAKEKMILCIWSDWKIIVHYELFPQNQKHRSQLDRLKRSVNEKRPELANRKSDCTHYNNARLRVSFKISTEVSRALLWCPIARTARLALISIHRKSPLGRTSVLRKPIKTSWTSASSRKIPYSVRIESWSCLKYSKR